MTRRKNALRIHEIAPYTAPADGGDPVVPEKGAWLRLAKRITSISDDSEESTESEGDYAGDGTEEDVLTGRSEKWKYEGTYDPTDPAQKLIKDLKRKTNDDDRLIWHRIHESDGTVVTGVAKVLDIVAGGGDATDYEDFTGSINFIKTPNESKDTPSTDDSGTDPKA